MGTKHNKFTRAPKRTPRSTRLAKPRPDDADEEVQGEALHKLSTAIALVETVSLAMQGKEHEPDFGSIAKSLEVAVCKLNDAHGDIDLVFMGATP